MFLRALCTCSHEFIDVEFKAIYDIGFMLKYPKAFRDKSFIMARKSFYMSAGTVYLDVNNLLVLPFSTKFNVVPHLLKSLNLSVAFSNNCTNKQLLIKN